MSTGFVGCVSGAFKLAGSSSTLLRPPYTVKTPEHMLWFLYFYTNAVYSRVTGLGSGKLINLHSRSFGVHTMPVNVLPIASRGYGFTSQFALV